MEYASNGKGNLGVTLGAIGTGLGVLNAHGGLGGILGGMTQAASAAACPENQAVNRYEMTLIQESTAKDSKIALLESEKYTDQKFVDVYSNLEGQINTLAAEVRKNKEEQQAVNMNQAVYNGTNTATISCLQGQVAQLMSITKVVIPNSSVCPGWGNVTITPTPAQTGTTVA